MPRALDDETLDRIVTYFHSEKYHYDPPKTGAGTRMAKCSTDHCLLCQRRSFVEKWIAHANVSPFARCLRILGLAALAEERGWPAYMAACRMANSHWPIFMTTVYAIPWERSGALRKIRIDGYVQLYNSIATVESHPYAREEFLLTPPEIPVDILAEMTAAETGKEADDVIGGQEAGGAGEEREGHADG